ncbi:MAG: ABC transporter substrate-binding protein, partial [Roseitalea porphyridii]
MKHFLAAALTAAALAISAPAVAQTPPNVLVVGQIAEPKSLDPHAVTAVNDFRILVNLYDGLTRYRDGTLEPEPSLAESWEVSDDGTVYTFSLRQ